MKNSKKVHKTHKDQISGGFADSSKPADFDQNELNMGIKVEMEHTDDPNKAREIAMDHLKEIPDYYTRLKKMEKEAKVKKSMDKTTRRISKFIERHNRKKLHKFQKSYDYQDLTVRVDAQDHQAAENANADLIKFIAEACEKNFSSDIFELSIGEGKLTLNKKGPGIYSGFFSDKLGQVIERFDDMTPALLAKNLEIKGYWKNPKQLQSEESNSIITEEPITKEETENQTLESAKEQLEVSPTPELEKQNANIKIKVGDVEIEIRKSIHSFVRDFRKAKVDQKFNIQKSILAWKRNMASKVKLESDISAAKELLSNWEQHKESFLQILYAIRQNNNE